MFKNLRKRYWYMRDRGKGGRFKLLCVTIVLAVLIVIMVGTKNIWMTGEFSDGEVVSGSAVSSDAVVVAPATGSATGAVSGTGVVSEPKEMESVSGSAATAGATDMPEVDTSGLSAFLSFMTDDAYEKLRLMVVDKCITVKSNYAKKLDYQKTGKSDFDIVSFIALSEGRFDEAQTILECDYNLKGNTLVMKETTYTEADIRKIQADEEAKAEKALKKEQQKAAKKAKKGKKSKKGTKSKRSKKSGKKMKKSKTKNRRHR